MSLINNNSKYKKIGKYLINLKISLGNLILIILIKIKGQVIYKILIRINNNINIKKVIRYNQKYNNNNLLIDNNIKKVN